VPRKAPQRVVVATGYDNNDKVANSSVVEYVIATECDFKHQVRQPKDHSKKHL
jgi:hypothetical protein